MEYASFILEVNSLTLKIRPTCASCGTRAICTSTGCRQDQQKHRRVVAVEKSKHFTHLTSPYRNHPVKEIPTLNVLINRELTGKQQGINRETTGK